MSQRYHGSPEYWLNMPVVELFEWTMIAQQLVEEEKARTNVQRIGPGL